MQLTIYGAGHQEWLLDLPRQGVFADIAKEIPNAKHFYLRPDVGGKDNLSIPMDLPLNDLRLYLADGYHVYAEGEQISCLQSGRSLSRLPKRFVEVSTQGHCQQQFSTSAHTYAHYSRDCRPIHQRLCCGTARSGCILLHPTRVAHNSTLFLYHHIFLFLEHPLVQQCLAIRRDHMQS